MLALVDCTTYMHCYNIIHNIASYSVHLWEYKHVACYVRLCTKH